MLVRYEELIILMCISKAWLIYKSGGTYQMSGQTGCAAHVQRDEQERSRCGVYGCPREIAFTSHELQTTLVVTHMKVGKSLPLKLESGPANSPC